VLLLLTFPAAAAADTTIAFSPTHPPPTHAAASLAAAAKRDKIKFSLRDITLHTTVGTGTFGRVRVVQYKPTKQWFAMKILKKSEIIRLKQVDHIKSEVKILTMISHPFIVNLIGHSHDDRRIYLLFEFVPGGELFSHLRREGRFTNDHARFYAAEITLAFEYLHNMSIAYRDLKPENLLLSAKGHMKVTDFGFAKVVEDRTWTVRLGVNQPHASPHPTPSHPNLTQPTPSTGAQLCGTPEYLAPEIIQSKGHNKSVDWWAVGILIYEMLAGYPPFFDETPFGIYQKILAGKIEFPKHFSTEAKDLVRKLLTADRTKRLGCLRGGASDIKEHPWYAKVDWEAVHYCGVRNRTRACSNCVC